MEKVSAKTFFAVLWKGVCQALGWLLGQFGYKRDGKFARCVWGLFATSAAIVMAIIAIGLLRARLAARRAAKTAASSGAAAQ